jgi:predicted Zn finger-like uncharacterized protein
MIIACPRCEASYAVEAAVFGPRNRVVQCSACDYRWSQRPHEALGAEKGEESPIASPNTGVGNPPDRLQPIREAEPMGLEAPVSEPAMPIAADEEPSLPAPIVGTVTAADTTDSLVDGQVRYALQEQPTPPSPPRADDAEAADGPIGDAPRIEHAQPDHRFGRALVAGMAALGTIITLLAALLLLRDPIVSALPDAAGIYRLIGLAPDPLGHGLEIRDVANTRERVGGEDVLNVTGVVANISGKREPLPSLRVSLYDPADDELQFVTVPRAQDSLDAGESVRFQATIPGARPEARRLRVGFAPP